MAEKPTDDTAAQGDDAAPIRYASLVAHQLKSPLSGAGTLLEAVLGGYAGELSAKQQDLLQRANLRFDEALKAIDRMLEIARPAQEGDETAACDAADVVRRQGDPWAERGLSSGVDVSVKVEGEGAPVPMNESAFTEVVQALVSNALKYTPEHGRVRVAVRPGEADDTVELRVADSGVGVPEDQRDRIFKPFYRTDTARASSRPGVGLGLAFVKTLVERVGGSVRVEKSPLGGALFVVVLPRIALPAPEAAPDAGTRRRILIIGGVTAGPKAAAKIIRLDPTADVTIVDKGQVLAYAGCGLPYYVSGAINDQRRLISTPVGDVRDPVFFQEVKNVHVRNQTTALRIDRQKKRVRVRNNLSGDETWLPYDTLILATGSHSVRPPVPGADLRNIFTLHGVQDAEGIRAAISQGRAKDVVIVGGGLLGVEVTEAIVRRGCRVTLVEAKPQILPILDWEIARLAEQHLEANGVRVLTETPPTGFEGEGSVEAIRTARGRLPADMVILGIGVRPNVGLARDAGIGLGETGAIAVDAHLRTNDPDIYAVGDCSEGRDLLTGKPAFMPLGSTAAKQGRAAAINICGGDEPFPGTLASAVCKIFEYCAARTGLTEAQARAFGYDVCCALVPAPDKAHFMPSARTLMLKVVVDRQTRRLLGVQAVGPGDGAKRIDVAATAITAGMTVDRIANLDFCYAPPYSPILDNLATASNVVRNKLDGVFTAMHPGEVHERLERGEELFLLDVRSPGEYEIERLAGSVLIPLGTLRGRMDEVPTDRPVICFCNFSLRGYEAALILQANGFQDVYVMDGGLAMWPFGKVR